VPAKGTTVEVRTQLESRLQSERDEIVRLVQDMVRIPSENPPGDTTALMEFVTRYLETRGIDYEVVAPQPMMPNLVATIEGGEPGKHLVLNGHLDAFPAGDPALWSDAPFSGTIRDGKLFGRGVTDMKVGSAASLLTFVYLAELRQHLQGKLTLTLVSDEEGFGPWGARYLLEHRPDVLGDCVLNGEPSTARTVRFGERGLLWLEMRVATKGGHGGYPQVSANAIKEIAGIIGELEDLTSIEVTMPDEVSEQIEAAREALDGEVGLGATDSVQRVNVNIGMIEGGTKMNMIAAHCRAEVDIRCPVGVDTESLLGRFEEILGRHAGASYTVVHRTEPNYCDPNHQMIRLVQRNAEAVRGIRPLPTISLAGTDCRLWRLKGIPAIVYGPTPHNMGAPDEYATLDDLLGTAAVHVLSAFDYLSGSTTSEAAAS
jgi:succinyl-diaminopimelate desuccinylase